jgi:hypothetical protein
LLLAPPALQLLLPALLLPLLHVLLMPGALQHWEMAAGPLPALLLLWLQKLLWLLGGLQP